MNNQAVHGKKYWKGVVAASVLLLGSLALVSLFPKVDTLASPQQYPALPRVDTVPSPQRYPTVVNPNSVVYGRTFGEWSAAWWQWAFSIPVANHPLFDNTDDCSIGQSGPVWFLGGKFCQAGPNAPPCTPGTATRVCTLPAGKALYFPIYNGEDSAPEEPDYGCGSSLSPLIPGTIAEMRKCVETWVEPVADATAEIDGRVIPNLAQNYHAQSTVFGITLPDDNVLKAIGENVSAGTYFPVVDEGVYLMLAPMSPGHHHIHFRAAGGQQDITYDLLVMQ
jgi:hypothetical protein